MTEFVIYSMMENGKESGYRHNVNNEVTIIYKYSGVLNNIGFLLPNFSGNHR